MSGLPARRAALQALRAVDEDAAWSTTAVAAAVSSLTDARDRAFAAHLAYETLRWEGPIDAALASVLTRDLDDVEPALRRVLRLGAVQLLVSQTPDRAAVSTSVTLAGEQVPAGRAKGAAGFVNGVLRGLARRGPPPPPPLGDDPVAHLAHLTAHPPWVVADLLTRFDVARTRSLLEADNRSPGVTLRAVADRGEVLEALAAEGVSAVRGERAEAVRAPGLDPSRSRVVADGLAVVQDEASMHVVEATGVRAGDRVLDLCAGPGGKTTHLASRVGPDGAVVAVEFHPHRARMVAEAARRVGVGVDVRVGDAADPPLAPDERFDVVLLDAPCTGLGTGRRRPEVRWRRTPDDVASLAALQRRLVVPALGRVDDGGVLTYAVCTWTRDETDAIADVVDAGPDRQAVSALGRRLFTPDVDGTDGMFVATWRRTAGVGGGG